MDKLTIIRQLAIHVNTFFFHRWHDLNLQPYVVWQWAPSNYVTLGVIRKELECTNRLWIDNDRWQRGIMQKNPIGRTGNGDRKEIYFGTVPSSGNLGRGGFTGSPSLMSSRPGREPTPIASHATLALCPAGRTNLVNRNILCSYLNSKWRST